ncbi:MAG: hypothetical protein H6600_01300 [Flavobacteriales bacterium]|nr:hypothetical protein [Flavobacteriales bacterium]
MRNSNFLIRTISAIAVLFFVACGSEDKTENLKHSTKYNMYSAIENLAVITSVDLISIIEKSGFESNKDLPMEASAGYKMFVKDKIDSEITGIDLTGNNHFAVSMKDQDKLEYIMFSAKVVNAENAKTTIKDIVKGKYTKEQTDGEEYEFVVKDDVAVGWDENDLVVVFSEVTDPKEIAQKLLQARYVDGPDNDLGMEDFLSAKADMNIYTRIGNATDVLKNSGVEIPAELISSLEDSYYIGSGNINDGEIVFSWDIHADKLKDSKYNALATKAINSSFYNYLTHDKLIGFGTASINMPAIIDALQLVPNKEFDLDEIAEQTGISIADMKTMFTGEIAVSFIDILREEAMITAEDDFFEDEFSYNTERPLLVVTFGIKDSAQIGGLLRLTGEAKIENGVYQMDKDAFITFHADKLILTSDKITAEYFAMGKSFESFKLPAGANNSTPLFGYLNTDLNAIPDGMLKLAETEEGQAGLEFLGLFESIQFNGEFERMEFKVVMKSKSENALKVITDYVLKMVKKNQLI